MHNSMRSFIYNWWTIYSWLDIGRKYSEILTFSDLFFGEIIERCFNYPLLKTFN